MTDTTLRVTPTPGQEPTIYPFDLAYTRGWLRLAVEKLAVAMLAFEGLDSSDPKAREILKVGMLACKTSRDGIMSTFNLLETLMKRTEPPHQSGQKEQSPDVT